MIDDLSDSDSDSGSDSDSKSDDSQTTKMRQTVIIIKKERLWLIINLPQKIEWFEISSKKTVAIDSKIIFSFYYRCVSDIDCETASLTCFGVDFQV